MAFLSLFVEPFLKNLLPLLKKGSHTTKFSLTDGRYYLRFTFFGDVRQIVEKIKENNGRVFVFGDVTLINNYPYLNNARFIDESESGKILPVYPSIARKIKSEALAAYNIKPQGLTFPKLPN